MPRRTPDLHLPDGCYRFERVLKADFFSVNELYAKDGKLHVLKKSRFRFIGGVLVVPLAILMSRRESRVSRQVADIEGLPPLGPRVGLAGYIHEFIPGRTLKQPPCTKPRRKQVSPLREDF